MKSIDSVTTKVKPMKLRGPVRDYLCAWSCDDVWLASGLLRRLCEKREAQQSKGSDSD